METFGEISEPSSRATWEDWDDLDNSSCSPELKWHNKFDIPEDIDNFFLFEGKYLWDGMLKEAKKNIEEINAIKEVNLHLYKVPATKNYICIVRDCDMILSNDVVKLIKGLVVKSKTVAVMQVKPLSEYITAKNIVQPCIIRKITTTSTLNLMTVDYPKLEQPNIVSAVSAGVFSLREHLSLSATLAVFYIDHSHVYEIGDIHTLLQKLDISQSGQVKHNPVLNTNLYI